MIERVRQALRDLIVFENRALREHGADTFRDVLKKLDGIPYKREADDGR